ncbi:plasmid recombination protein [Nodularia spumigena CS-586/05]|uniref:MobV family relaxase n=1 Tax=Nodularia spumigena TaxID=70799 RepID=UPI00232FE1B6|nr:MobV family relaxase [Nodularia spumigena]MDB9368341.1 plasmid recombination protein [Nodularia spumigena CS-586/05]
MAGLAIFRVIKLKSFGNVGGSEAHTARLQDTPNADPQKMNLRLIGDGNLPLKEIVQLKIQSCTKYKPRKNAVLCSEMFLSASPEYFRPYNPSLAGEWDNNRMLEFANASKNWLLENYGDKCVRAELHLDEATPHIHAYIVPINDKTKQLSHKAMFGGDGRAASIKLSKLQDSYAAALAPLGIERGVKGSQATHTKVKEYYQAVNSEPLTLQLERFAPQIGETAQRFYTRLKTDPVIQALDHQLADRQRAIEHEQRAVQNAIASEKLRQQLEAENLMLQQHKELLRDLPLEDVAWHLGLDRDYNQPGIWKGHGHIININDSKFYEFTPIKAGGVGAEVQQEEKELFSNNALSSNASPRLFNGSSAIELVMHVNQCNDQQAYKWLHDSFGKQGVERAIIAQFRKLATEIAQFEPRPKFVPPAPDERQWYKVEDYLTQERGLLPSFLQAVHEQGLIYADEKQNAVFLMRNLEGETKGAFLNVTGGEDNSFEGYVTGSKRTQGWFHLKLGGEPNGEIEKVVLCKSPIEALSFATLEMEVQQGIPKTRTMYMAVDSPKSLPVEFLQTVPHVEVAYDNDPVGNETARIIMEQLHHAMRVKPKGKDWNDTLSAWRKQQKKHRDDQQHQQPGPELEL